MTHEVDLTHGCKLTTKIANISGHARPSDALRRQLGIVHGPGTVARLDALMSDADAIDKLAQVIDVALLKGQAADGRIDLRVVAAHVIAELKAAQKG